MKVDSEKLVELARELKRDIGCGCCRSSAPIGKVGAVTFELVAYSKSEAEEQGIEEPREFECLTR